MAKTTVKSIYTPTNYIVLNLQEDKKTIRATIVYGMSNLSISVNIRELISAIKLLCTDST